MPGFPDLCWETPSIANLEASAVSASKKVRGCSVSGFSTDQLFTSATFIDPPTTRIPEPEPGPLGPTSNNLWPCGDLTNKYPANSVTKTIARNHNAPRTIEPPFRYIFLSKQARPLIHAALNPYAPPDQK